MKKKLLAFLAMLVISPPLEAQEILNPEVKPGEVLVIRASPDLPVRVLDRTYLPNRSGLIFVGLELTTEPGTYHLENGSFFRVGAIEAAVRRRKPGRIGPKRKQELQALSRAYARMEMPEWYPAEAFRTPLEEVFITSEFMIGHGGADLRARTPTPVHAVSAGKVLMVARRFSLEGNMVIIDHGSGVLSLYMHLSSVSVREGQTVEKGRLLGRTGRTGAVNGPHLHFSVKVNGTNVDPLAFIENMNEILFR